MYPFLLHRRPYRLGYLVDGSYDGNEGRAVLRFLDPHTQTFFKWSDSTGHQPYLLSSASTRDVQDILLDDKEFLGVRLADKYDAVLDRVVTLRKVIASNPLAIGGERDKGVRRDNFRDILQNNGHQVWEAWIRYHLRYVYDRGLEFGMPYYVRDDGIVPQSDAEVFRRIGGVVASLLMEPGVLDNDELRHWVRLFEHPLPKVGAASLDIEVLPEDPRRMANPLVAAQPVITVSFRPSTGKKIVLMLKRTGVAAGEGKVDAELKFFATEKELVLETFRIMKKYSLIVTFNGDDFDLMYLYNRAKKHLKIPQWAIPIYIVRKQCKLKNGIHIDLYPFMKNKSIQNYAFKETYKDFDLDSISKALLGKGKLKMGYEKLLTDVTYMELARYCLRDAELTYELLTFNNDTVLNLLWILSRMANFPIEDICRQKISNWIRSTLYYLLAKKNILIPSQEQLKSKGEAQTKPKIEGKKYAGAIVREPTAGIHFNVKVLDFASLYPSEVKLRNIGYSTLNCAHFECQANLVPETNHHICTKNRAVEADAIGSLRDIRVFVYKPKSKEKDLSEEEKGFYSALEQSIKVYLNAQYGIFGYEKFAFYTPPVPESVTAFARRDMNILMEKAEKIGVDVLAGDTDSVCLKNPTDEQVDALRHAMLGELGLDLDIDKVYRYVVFSRRKKNYLGVFEDGRVDIKGLTGKKRHMPPIIKNSFFEMMEVLGGVEAEDEFEPAKRKIWETIRAVYHKIKHRKWDDVKDLAFSMRLGRHPNSYETNPQHVKAARMMMEMGYDMQAGDVVEYIKSTGEGGVMPLMDADSEKVNTKAYIGQLQSVVNQFIEPLGISWDSDIAGIMKLDNFPSEDGIVKKSVLLESFLPQNA